MAKKTTKVMWASKHEPEQAQLRELRRLFGEDVAVDNYPNRIQGGQELYRILISQNYDELVLVAPERVFILCRRSANLIIIILMSWLIAINILRKLST